MPSPTLEPIASRLRAARSVVVLTGAGVSAESGLRTFRGATAADLPSDMQTLWKEFDPQTLATPEAFEANPEMVSRWYDWRRQGCLAAEPNPGHLALAAIEDKVTARGGSFTLLTQNVDRLHHKAGSRNVVELHGSIIVWRCTRCARRVQPSPQPFESYPPPAPCHASGGGAKGLLRPDVVWFGEMLPEDAIRAAGAATESCDLFLSVGTSAVVYPAAGYIQVAAANGAFTVEINREDTPVSRQVDRSLRASSGEVLPEIVRLAFGA